jgi:hypothetical protein
MFIDHPNGTALPYTSRQHICIVPFAILQAAKEAADRAKRDQLKNFNQRVSAANLGRNASETQVQPCASSHE